MALGQLAVVAAIVVLGVLGRRDLPDARGRLAAGAFLSCAWATWAGVCFFAWRGRADNRSHAGPACETGGRGMGWATRLTLLRGAVLALLGGQLGACLVTSQALLSPEAMAICYGAVVLADRYDGYLARRHGDVTVLGGRLDVVLDALGVALAAALAVWGGALPVCYLALGLAYPLFQGFLWVRTRLGLRVERERLRLLPPARLYAGVQMVFMTAALADVLGRRTTFLLAPFVMSPPLVLFGWEALVVCGALDEDRARRWLGARRRAAEAALALLRVLAGILAVAVMAMAARAVAVGELAERELAARAFGYADGGSYADGTRFAGVFARLSPLSGPASVLAVASLLALLGGVTPRVAALLLVVLLAPIHEAAPTAASVLALLLAAIVVLFGGGAGTRFSPEELWAIRPAGAPKTPP